MKYEDNGIILLKNWIFIDLLQNNVWFWCYIYTQFGAVMVEHPVYSYLMHQAFMANIHSPKGLLPVQFLINAIIW